MPSATAWRRRDESTPRRGSSPARPAAESIERLSPEPYPATPPSSNHNLSRIRRQVNGNSLQGLGLSHTALSSRAVADPDHLYLDSDGRAHLGAKLKSPKHAESSSKTSRAPTTQYRGPPKRNHARTASAMSIDDLANIAIATSPQFSSTNPTFSFGTSPIFHSTSRPNTSYINGYTQDSFDRPAKRVKSERLYQSEWTRQEERPRSSYTYQSEVRQEDAELLLSLANEFSFKKSHQRSPTLPTKTEPIPEEPESTPQKVEPQSEWHLVSEEHQSPDDDHIEHVSKPTSHHSQHEPVETHQDDAGSQDTAEDLLDRNQEKLPLTEPKTPEVQRDDSMEQEEYRPPIQAATGTVESEAPATAAPLPQPIIEKKPRRIPVDTTQPVCPVCNQINSNAREGESTIEWINCEGSCNRWFHIPCAGFTAQAVKKVAKFICKDCEPQHGATTYTRTSSRARAALDYAALNEGVAMSNEEATMHHFVPRFKDGSIHYHADNWARIRPELLTRELWENFDGMKRPFVVPSIWNPRYGSPAHSAETSEFEERGEAEEKMFVMYTSDGEIIKESKELDDIPAILQPSTEEVIDLDQDYLDMVMSRDLTVPKVAELYGPHEPVPVIDVKTQETTGSFTLAKWATYYEERGIKDIKNVISLEVSHSRLGRLIRRPRVVRDVDLEDQVWDADSRAATRKTQVAFYCLMSVGDSYTDFHIDFGGSSVYYHILKGQKTFFFIPPEDRYLKKYQEWNDNPNQKQIWLGDWCDGNVTRVDLFPGDTAFIPAGWIHSVWTPEDSLVIGGNFLTRYDLDMQLKVAEIERANGVSAKFKYPFFQKVMWYTLIKYLEDDPVPDSVVQAFEDDVDNRYLRAVPVWLIDDGNQAEIDPEGTYNARNYSKSELRGLPALRDYLYRTARIYADLPVIPAVTKDAAKRVGNSIPKGHGDPLQLICLFAVWVAWKRGNEKAPEWIHGEPAQQDAKEKDKTAKKNDKVHIPPERVSTRRKNRNADSPAPTRQETPETDDSGTPSRDSRYPYRRIACAACRRKNQLCRHPPFAKLDESAKETLEKTRSYSNVTIDIAKLARASPVVNSIEGSAAPPKAAPQIAQPQATSTSDESAIEISSNTDLASAAIARISSQPPESDGITMNGITPTPAPGSAKKGRSKACDECRKSKRRCVHDEHGRVDPAKAAEPSKPRGSNSSKRPPRLSDEHHAKRPKLEEDFAVYGSSSSHEVDAMIDPALMVPALPIMSTRYPDPVPLSDVNAFSAPPQPLTTQNSFLHQSRPPPRQNVDLNLDPALMDPALLQSVSSQALSAVGDFGPAQPPALPRLSTATMSTPDVDKSFSPLTAEEVSASKRDSEDGQTQSISTPANGILQNIAASASQANGIAHALPKPRTDVHTTDSDRRPSSTEAAATPKQEVTSPDSRPSSSHTSNTTHRVELPSGAGQDDTTIVVQQTSPSIKRETMSPKVKSEIPASPPTRQFQRADTAVSSTSSPVEDASEKLARELAAEEHGLRRRASVRIS